MEDPCNVENTLCCHALPLIFCCHPGARQEVIMELPKVVKCDPLEPWTVHPKDYLDVPKVLSSTPPRFYQTCHLWKAMSAHFHRPVQGALTSHQLGGSRLSRPRVE